MKLMEAYCVINLLLQASHEIVAYLPIMFKTRHLIGIIFANIKQFRAIATPYDMTARNFLAAVHLVVKII